MHLSVKVSFEGHKIIEELPASFSNRSNARNKKKKKKMMERERTNEEKEKQTNETQLSKSLNLKSKSKPISFQPINKDKEIALKRQRENEPTG